MYGATARGARAYYQTQVQSQSPVELVVMLYDGALRFMRTAADAIERRDLVGKRDAMSRTMAIVSELQSSLNLEAGGEVAANLDRLYTYINERLIDANVRNAAEPVREAIKLMTPLRDAWSQVAVPGYPPSIQERR